MSTTVPASTITREPAESTIPRTAKFGRMFASVLLGDLFIAHTGGEAPETMCRLSKVDGLNLINALADVLDVEVQVTER